MNPLDSLIQQPAFWIFLLAIFFFRKYIKKRLGWTEPQEVTTESNQDAVQQFVSPHLNGAILGITPLCTRAAPDGWKDVIFKAKIETDLGVVTEEVPLSEVRINNVNAMLGQPGGTFEWIPGRTTELERRAKQLDASNKAYEIAIDQAYGKTLGQYIRSQVDNMKPVIKELRGPTVYLGAKGGQPQGEGGGD